MDEAARDAAARPGPLTVIPGALVHPADDHIVGIIRHATDELGCRVLKLHCSVGDFEADDPRLDPAWIHLSGIRLPVVVHVGHGTSGKTERAELAPIERVAPRLTEPSAVPHHRLAAVAHKLLFGSDAPNTGVVAGETLRTIQSFPLPPEAVRAITGDTARRLLAAVHA